ncbi:uncharacterized protein IAS62_003841 [Cryptococcus decagattii]|uniref:Uncharacterized protein n=1 Tax=Cryptococcus decagattii TaxID=1859122 RepID=A0ABZ2AVE6_9TREE
MVPESPPFSSAKFITHSPDSETSVERFDFLPIPPVWEDFFYLLQSCIAISGRITYFMKSGAALSMPKGCWMKITLTSEFTVMRIGRVQVPI